MTILCALANRPHRFGELRRAIPGIAHKVLIQQLRQLQQAGLVNRQNLGGNPPGVEYSISSEAEGLCPILKELDAWWQVHLVKNKVI